MSKPTPIKASDLYKNEVKRLKGRIAPRTLLIELNKVYRAGVEMFLSNGQLDTANIAWGFLWCESPQGQEFWSNLHYDYGR